MCIAFQRSGTKQLGHSIKKSFQCTPQRSNHKLPQFPEAPEKTIDLSFIVWVWAVVVCMMIALIAWLIKGSLLYSTIIGFWGDSLCSCHMWFWMSDFYNIFWISTKVVYSQHCLIVTWLVPHETVDILAHVLCTSYNHAPVYFVTSFEARCGGCMCV